MAKKNYVPTQEFLKYMDILKKQLDVVFKVYHVEAFRELFLMPS